MKYFNVEYLKRNGVGNPTFDSSVISMPDSTTRDEAVQHLLEAGFVRRNTEVTSYDEEEVIMPGAIMSVRPCNSRGYSKADLERAAKNRYRGAP